MKKDIALFLQDDPTSILLESEFGLVLGMRDGFEIEELDQQIKEAYLTRYPFVRVQCRLGKSGLFSYAGWAYLLMDWIFGTNAIIRWGLNIYLPLDPFSWRRLPSQQRYYYLKKALDSTFSTFPYSIEKVNWPFDEK